MSTLKNTWSKERVLDTPEKLREVCLRDLSANNVLIFSIGSFVGESSAGYQSSIQMHPGFADGLADLGYDLKVFNLDQKFNSQPLSEKVLDRAHVFYSTVSFEDKEFFENLLQEIFNVGAKVILIDNVGRTLLPITEDIGLNNANFIHEQLEIIHRYICHQDGIAFLYDAETFKNKDTLDETVKKAMAPADGCDCYAGGGSHDDKRQRWINEQKNHQATLDGFATFFAQGLQEITADKLFEATHQMSDEESSDTSYEEDEENQNEKNRYVVGLKIAAFILAVLFTFPVSLPVLGFYYSGHFKQKGAHTMSKIIPEMFISSKYMLQDNDESVSGLSFLG